MHAFESLSVSEGSVGIHWFGQNSFALKDAGGTIVLVDPYFPHERPPERFIHPEPPLDEADLRPDYVLLTHDHGDHTCIESLQRIHAAHPDAKLIGPPESVRRMLDSGIPEQSLMTVHAGEALDLGTMRATALWSKPPQGAPEDGIAPPDVDHLGYVIDVGPVSIYITGDLINTFAEHDELVEPVAALEPDIGLLTMHPTEGEFPYFEGAVSLAMKLDLKAVVPAHYECFTKRTYDPHQWAVMLPPDGPKPVVIPYNTAIVYSPA